MPIFDYVLLALLASGGHRLDNASLAFGPDAITQPKGGGLIRLAENLQRGIKLNGIKGESQDDKHKDEIHLLSPSNQNKNPLKNTPTLSPQNNMRIK
jgi:hypothetical protein